MSEESLEEQLREIADRAKSQTNGFQTTKNGFVASKNLEGKLKEISSHVVLPAGRYIVDFDIVITESGTLEIEPGAEFYFGPRAGIISYGVLKAVGTEKKKIIFRARSEQSSWRNIAIAGKYASDTILEYCEISHGSGRKVIQARGNFKGIEGEASGGGLLIAYSDPTIKYCKIYNNKNWIKYGGGISLRKSSPTLERNTITRNTAEQSGGGLDISHSNPTLKRNSITRNTAKWAGGGLYLSESDPFLEGNTITQNVANFGGVGGGLHLYNSNPVITSNNKITDNKPDNIHKR